MTPQGGDERIRHLPPDGEGRPPQGRAHYTPSPRVVLFASIAAVLGVILLVFGLGGGDPIDVTATTQAGLAASGAVPNITTSTLPPPPKLTELLGQDTGPLRLIVDEDGTTTARLWFPDRRSARTYAVSAPVDSVTLDATGVFAAYRQGGALWVGQVGHTSVTFVSDRVDGVAWHPSREGVFAYIAEEDHGTFLWTAAGIAELDLVQDLDLVAAVPRGTTLAGFGSWGFAVTMPVAGVPYAVVLDPSGAPVRGLGGTIVTAGGDKLLVEGDGPTPPPGDMPFAVFPSHDGFALVDISLTNVLLELGGTAAELPDVLIDRDGGRVALSTVTSAGRTSITVIDFASRVPRVLPFDDRATTIAFVRNGEALALQNATSGDLSIVDWRTGAQAVVPGEPAVIVLDVSL